MFEDFNESARRAIFFARYEATRLGKQLIGSEHVLLGVLREGDPGTTELWRGFSLEPDSIRVRFPSVETSIPSSVALPISDDVQKILANAIEESERRQDSEVTPCHLILGILRVPECQAATLLTEYGVEYDIVSEFVRVLQHQMRKRAETESIAIRLRESHYELLDRIAERMNLPESRSADRQSLLLTLLDGFAASGVASQTFQSLEDFRIQVQAAFRQRWPDA